MCLSVHNNRWASKRVFFSKSEIELIICYFTIEQFVHIQYGDDHVLSLSQYGYRDRWSDPKPETSTWNLFEAFRSRVKRYWPNVIYKLIWAQYWIDRKLSTWQVSDNNWTAWGCPTLLAVSVRLLKREWSPKKILNYSVYTTLASKNGVRTS